MVECDEKSVCVCVCDITCDGRGGAGRGGGCFAFFGGNAGLGDSGRGGGAVFGPIFEPNIPIL